MPQHHPRRQTEPRERIDFTPPPKDFDEELLSQEKSLYAREQRGENIEADIDILRQDTRRLKRARTSDGKHTLYDNLRFQLGNQILEQGRICGESESESEAAQRAEKNISRGIAALRHLFSEQDGVNMGSLLTISRVLKEVPSDYRLTNLSSFHEKALEALNNRPLSEEERRSLEQAARELGDGVKTRSLAAEEGVLTQEELASLYEEAREPFTKLRAEQERLDGRYPNKELFLLDPLKQALADGHISKEAFAHLKEVILSERGATAYAEPERMASASPAYAREKQLLRIDQNITQIKKWLESLPSETKKNGEEMAALKKEIAELEKKSGNAARRKQTAELKEQLKQSDRREGLETSLALLEEKRSSLAASQDTKGPIQSVAEYEFLKRLASAGLKYGYTLAGIQEILESKETREGNPNLIPLLQRLKTDIFSGDSAREAAEVLIAEGSVPPLYYDRLLQLAELSKKSPVHAEHGRPPLRAGVEEVEGRFLAGPSLVELKQELIGVDARITALWHQRKMVDLSGALPYLQELIGVLEERHRLNEELLSHKIGGAGNEQDRERVAQAIQDASYSIMKGVAQGGLAKKEMEKSKDRAYRDSLEEIAQKVQTPAALRARAFSLEKESAKILGESLPKGTEVHVEHNPLVSDSDSALLMNRLTLEMKEMWRLITSSQTEGSELHHHVSLIKLIAALAKDLQLQQDLRAREKEQTQAARARREQAILEREIGGDRARSSLTFARPPSAPKAQKLFEKAAGFFKRLLVKQEREEDELKLYHLPGKGVLFPYYLPKLQGARAAGIIEGRAMNGMIRVLREGRDPSIEVEDMFTDGRLDEKAFDFLRSLFSKKPSSEDIEDLFTEGKITQGAFDVWKEKQRGAAIEQKYKNLSRDDIQLEVELRTVEIPRVERDLAFHQQRIARLEKLLTNPKLEKARKDRMAQSLEQTRKDLPKLEKELSDLNGMMRKDITDTDLNRMKGVREKQQKEKEQKILRRSGPKPVKPSKNQKKEKGTMTKRGRPRH